MMIHTDEILRRRGLDEGGRAQKYVDSTVLRLCAPFVPLDTGTLMKSGKKHTVIGSGVVKYSTPYARTQYYYNGGYGRNGTQNGGARGRLWFKRMKALHLKEIKEGVKQICRRQ